MASSTEVHPNWLGHGQSKTIEGWFSAILHDADLDCFGGYPGEADWFDEVIVVNDPGLESGKYAHRSQPAGSHAASTAVGESGFLLSGFSRRVLCSTC